MEHILKEVVETIIGLVGNEFLYFNDALEVKRTPHDFDRLHIWGACVSPSGELYLMDADEQWHELQTVDQGAGEVLNSLYHRVKLIERRISSATIDARISTI